MNLFFDPDHALAYKGTTQRIRVLTETWAGHEIYCFNCCNDRVTRFANNQPVADFHCPRCLEQYELKSQRHAFGTKIVDGAYSAMIARVNGNDNPNLLLMNYDLASLSVTNLFVVPKQFLTESIIEKRKPLATTARRAGWVGCKILLDRIPRSGRVQVVQNGRIQPISQVRRSWKNTLFVREITKTDARGWLLNVIRCIEAIGEPTFTLDQLYAQESDLREIYPGNGHIREKIRQQLQVLRDKGFLEFRGQGTYRLCG